MKKVICHQYHETDLTPQGVIDTYDEIGETYGRKMPVGFYNDEREVLHLAMCLQAHCEAAIKRLRDIE